jgi:hypothetical protein
MPKANVKPEVKMIYVKPAVEGSVIRHPEKINYRIPPEGEWVQDSNQWRRYLRAGDVVLAEPSVADKAQKAEKPADAPKASPKEKAN